MKPSKKGLLSDYIHIKVNKNKIFKNRAPKSHRKTNNCQWINDGS